MHKPPPPPCTLSCFTSYFQVFSVLPSDSQLTIEWTLSHKTQLILQGLIAGADIGMSSLIGLCENYSFVPLESSITSCSFSVVWSCPTNCMPFPGCLQDSLSSTCYLLGLYLQHVWGSSHPVSHSLQLGIFLILSGLRAFREFLLGMSFMFSLLNTDFFGGSLSSHR